jgi:hypothetical protein
MLYDLIRSGGHIYHHLSKFNIKTRRGLKGDLFNPDSGKIICCFFGSINCGNRQAVL